MTLTRGGGSVTRVAYLGRIQNRAHHLPVDLTRVANALNKALDTSEELLADEDKAIRLKAVHALGQTTTALLRVLEVGEMEARLAELEIAELARNTVDER